MSTTKTKGTRARAGGKAPAESWGARVADALVRGRHVETFRSSIHAGKGDPAFLLDFTIETLREHLVTLERHRSRELLEESNATALAHMRFARDLLQRETASAEEREKVLELFKVASQVTHLALTAYPAVNRATRDAWRVARALYPVVSDMEVRDELVRAVKSSAEAIVLSRKYLEVSPEECADDLIIAMCRFAPRIGERLANARDLVVEAITHSAHRGRPAKDAARSVKRPPLERLLSEVGLAASDAALRAARRRSKQKPRDS